MAIVTTDNQHYADIAAAIRSKTGTETLYKPSEMAAAIMDISVGGSEEPEPPNDGKTRLYIHIPENSFSGRAIPRNQVPLYFQQSVAMGVAIDWGDNSGTQTLYGTGKVNTSHVYNEPGDFVISLEPQEDCELNLGHSSISFCVMGTTANTNKVYTNMLKKVILGNNINNIAAYSFNYCYALKSITMLGSIESIGSYAFSNCYTLESFNVPTDVVDIGTYAFQSCYGLASITFPENLKSIGNYAFRYCYGIKEYHFLSSIPPALGGTNVFNSTATDKVFYVPVGALEAYESETNYSSISDDLQERTE